MARTLRYAVLLSCCGLVLNTCIVAAETGGFASHPPQRPLPKPATPRSAEEGPRLYVDPVQGDDAATGDQDAPWRTLQHALRQLRPGDTLVLRGGVYYEQTALVRSGTAESPITIESAPGELAILDGGLREFFEEPASAWIPFDDGAEGEYVSTRTFPHADSRRPPGQFLPAAWEPMWGIEHERPLALGNFGDSMTPLHGYRLAVDLRSNNELWIGGKQEMRDTGLYCGPGLWFNRETGRIHIRLAHHRLDGLGINAYRGETDPRRLPLVVAVGFGEEVLRLTGIDHVRIRDIVLRGATGSPMISLYGCRNVELDGLTVYGGFPALLINASQDVRVVDSAFRGLAAPWTSRAHMKYRGTASYQIVLRDDQPRNADIEFVRCEFTDDHDFAYLRYVTNLQFHHNFVDNFNDDGLECGPKLRDHSMFIFQNRIGRCLIPLTQHEIEADESPIDHDPESGAFIYRNVFDMRGGVYKGPPESPDPTGAFLRQEGHLVGDHGSPVWNVMRVYHNTFLRDTPVFRDYYLFGLGAQGLRQNERDVFNNVFVQTGQLPGVGFAGIEQAGPLRAGGNIIWSPAAEAAADDDHFASFRKSRLFADSRSHYEPGWTTEDRAVDPGFNLLSADSIVDLRLQSGSAAINAGIPLPAEWPDSVRPLDAGPPDIGVLPFGAEAWGVGVRGRIPLFGTQPE